MTAALLLFLAAGVVPIFFGRLGKAAFWLALQALALAWVTLLQHEPGSTHALAAAGEVLLLRAVLAPLLLRRAIRARAEPDRDLLPSNLFAWAIGVALFVLAFEFGAPRPGDAQALALGVVAVMVAGALLLLAANDAPPAQLVAVLFMENALALFEARQGLAWPLAVHLALSLVYALTAVVGCWLVGRADPAPAVEPSAAAATGAGGRS